MLFLAKSAGAFKELLVFVLVHHASREQDHLVELILRAKFLILCQVAIIVIQSFSQ